MGFIHYWETGFMMEMLGDTVLLQPTYSQGIFPAEKEFPCGSVGFGQGGLFVISHSGAPFLGLVRFFQHNLFPETGTLALLG